jgi:hypothetical protein
MPSPSLGRPFEGMFRVGDFAVRKFLRTFHHFLKK